MLKLLRSWCIVATCPAKGGKLSIKCREDYGQGYLISYL